jgi:hypothetical protein
VAEILLLDDVRAPPISKSTHMSFWFREKR